MRIVGKKWFHGRYIFQEKNYNYRCGECGYEQEVPYFVVDEFAVIEGLEPGNMPVLECGSLDGELNVLIKWFRVVERYWSIKFTLSGAILKTKHREVFIFKNYKCQRIDVKFNFGYYVYTVSGK